MKNAVVLGCPDREVMTIVIAFHGSGFRTLLTPIYQTNLLLI